MTDAELRSLLVDCLTLWSIDGDIIAAEDGLRITTAMLTCDIRSGPPPTRWFLRTAARTRPAPSITALLSALRRALDAEAGRGLRVGAPGG